MRRITDRNWRSVPKEYGILPRYLEYGGAEARASKLVPVSDYPDMLIPWDEFKERIQEAHEKRTMPIYHYKASPAVPKNQTKFGYCWTYSLTSAVEVMRVREGQPYRRLAPNTLGWLVDWKNVGNHMTSAIEGAMKRGIASSEFAADNSIDPKTFIPGWQEDALRHKPSEWFDTVGVDRRRRSEKEMVQQCVSLLLGPALPGYVGHNWWGHATGSLGVRWDENELYNLVWQEVNSHGDGLIELTGQHGIPDEAYFLGSSVFSP